MRLVKIGVLGAVLAVIAFSSPLSASPQWLATPPALLPAALSSFMQNYFTYATDTEVFNVDDYWQKPEEFLQSRRGDCEDFALMAQKALNDENIPADVLCVYGADGLAHTVTVFKAGSKYQIMDCGKILPDSNAKLESLLSAAYPNWAWACTATAKNNRGHAVKRISRLG